MAENSNDPRLQELGCDPHAPARCQCRPQVLRAYAGMIASGAPPAHALQVAARVYQWHHPGEDENIAGLIAERWVVDRRVH